MNVTSYISKQQQTFSRAAPFKYFIPSAYSHILLAALWSFKINKNTKLRSAREKKVIAKSECNTFRFNMNCIVFQLFAACFLRSNIKHYATTYKFLVFLGLSFYRLSSTKRSKEASHKSSFMYICSRYKRQPQEKCLFLCQRCLLRSS